MRIREALNIRILRIRIHNTANLQYRQVFFTGAGSRSVLVTNGSGSEMPKIIWILRIRIHNTANLPHGQVFLPFGLRLDDSGAGGHTGGLRPRGRGGRGGRVRAPHHTQVNDLPRRLHRHNLQCENVKTETMI
jgi:hypothetical protein